MLTLGTRLTVVVAESARALIGMSTHASSSARTTRGVRALCIPPIRTMRVRLSVADPMTGLKARSTCAECAPAHRVSAGQTVGLTPRGESTQMCGRLPVTDGQTPREPMITYISTARKCRMLPASTKTCQMACMYFTRFIT